MKEEIINLSKKLNIDIIGFTKLENYTELEKKYEEHEKRDYKCSFEIGTIYEKVHIKDKYKEYNSAVVIGVSYNNSIGLEDKVYLSSFCWGEDYHKVLETKLKKIASVLAKKDYKYKIFVDNNILDERYIAYKAGLGFYGKNHLLINEELGSNFFIGILLTDCIFEYDKQIHKECYNCDKCIKSCPNNAISEVGINSNKCLSYLTQKKNLKESEKYLINNCIYGCDICSNVCPYNKNKKSKNFKLDNKSIIKNFNEINEEEWNKIYKNTACFWRGRNVLNRNIKLLEEKLAKKL